MRHDTFSVPSVLDTAEPGADGEVERWDGDAFSAVDGSLSTLVMQLVRALVGLTIAYLMGRVLSDEVFHLSDSEAGVGAATAIHVALSGVALFLTSARPIRRDLSVQRSTIAANEAAMLQRVAQQAFLRDVHDALEMSETEGDALDVAGDAMAEALPGPAELLLADASRAHLRRAASATGSEAPGCGVETPWGCPAVRRGRTLTFDRSDHLGACPRLRDRGGDPCSAVCVQIGRAHV